MQETYLHIFLLNPFWAEKEFSSSPGASPSKATPSLPTSQQSFPMGSPKNVSSHLWGESLNQSSTQDKTKSVINVLIYEYVFTKPWEGKYSNKEGVPETMPHAPQRSVMGKLTFHKQNRGSCRQWVKEQTSKQEHRVGLVSPQCESGSSRQQEK